MTITTYNSLKEATAEWLDRAGEMALLNRFDDFLVLTEQRIYYGKDAVPSLQLPRCEPLRIRQMELIDSAFALTDGVAQPNRFLELLQATLNSPRRALAVVAEAVLDSHGEDSGGQVIEIANSGTSFRCWPTGGGTVTLRYFARMDTPAADGTNWLLTNAPGVYLNGCIAEAALHTADHETARLHLALYAADVTALNERRNAELAHAGNVRMRLRSWMP